MHDEGHIYPGTDWRTNHCMNMNSMLGSITELGVSGTALGAWTVGVWCLSSGVFFALVDLSMNEPGVRQGVCSRIEMSLNARLDRELPVLCHDDG